MLIQTEIKHTVKSSNISSITHKSEQKLILVEFLNGNIYEYADVSDEVANSLISADSTGKYLNENIKGKFAYRKIS